MSSAISKHKRLKLGLGHIDDLAYLQYVFYYYNNVVMFVWVLQRSYIRFFEKYKHVAVNRKTVKS